MDSKGDLEAAGPTLYLESGELDSTEAFCTEVFDDEKKGEYRVVQLTASQSFESLSDELNARLEHIEDPSEAAVIITTPQDDEEATSTQVGDATPLYGFRVSPEDLTGISIAFSQIIERWEETEGSVEICLRDLESLFPYHDTDLLYRFLNTVLATLQGAGADVHMHLQPGATDDQALQMFSSLFAEVVEADASPLESDSDSGSGTGGEVESADAPDRDRTDSGTEPEPRDAGAESDDTATSAMSEAEIESFLGEEGYGTLAFGGESPYAIPMSYGYDPEAKALYMQLSTFEGSEKQARMDGETPVSFVVSRHDRSDQWRSVVVEGTLSELSGADLTEDVLDAFSGSDLATVDVFDRDLSEIDFEWYVLRPGSMSGRQSTR